MKTKNSLITLCALLGATVGAQAAPVLIPNGDFSTAGGADFGFFESAVGVVSFPASGGSGDNGGYGLVDNTVPGASWGGGLVSPPDNTYPEGRPCLASGQHLSGQPRHPACQSWADRR